MGRNSEIRSKPKNGKNNARTGKWKNWKTEEGWKFGNTGKKEESHTTMKVNYLLIYRKNGGDGKTG